jgi:hypothetical protein
MKTALVAGVFVDSLSANLAALTKQARRRAKVISLHAKENFDSSSDADEFDAERKQCERLGQLVAPAVKPRRSVPRNCFLEELRPRGIGAPKKCLEKLTSHVPASLGLRQRCCICRCM